MGGEIKLDWSQVVIPVGNKKVKLDPEEKSKCTVLKYDYLKAQILYQDFEFGNYMMFTKGIVDESESEQKEVEASKKDKIP